MPGSAIDGTDGSSAATPVDARMISAPASPGHSLTPMRRLQPISPSHET